MTNIKIEEAHTSLTVSVPEEDFMAAMSIALGITPSPGLRLIDASLIEGVSIGENYQDINVNNRRVHLTFVGN